MKTLFLALFCALLAISLARPQQSYEKNGPAKLYKDDGKEDNGDAQTAGGDGGLKLDGDDDGYGTGGLKLDGDDDGYGTGGKLQNLYSVKDSVIGLKLNGDGKSENGEPVLATGEPEQYKVAEYDDQSGVGEPLAVTGEPEGGYKYADDDKSENGEPVAATGEPGSVYLHTSHIVANAYKVSSAIVHKHGSSAAHLSRNGPHLLIARK
ncbi:hypothetical protein CAEBREN_31340 [Caenorhabditis brenneri]|uniref:Uncharacterized protein n=1 Tax=Caenorhabditis brenneri TaxID=135651 RepID=G0MXT2_CAEBE|nr:hypothetical protein CAEBREN_31340 [Caenorhabditis brenneri]